MIWTKKLGQRVLILKWFLSTAYKYTAIWNICRGRERNRCSMGVSDWLKNLLCIFTNTIKWKKCVRDKSTLWKTPAIWIAIACSLAKSFLLYILFVLQLHWTRFSPYLYKWELPNLTDFNKLYIHTSRAVFVFKFILVKSDDLITNKYF